MMKSSQSPTASVRTADSQRTVTFDYRRLLAIELATGGTVLQLVQEFASYAPDDAADPKSQETATLRFSVTKAAQFIAGCLDVRVDDLSTIVPLSGFRDAFFALMPGFVEAVKQLNGVGEDQAAHPPVAQVSAS